MNKHSQIPKKEEEKPEIEASQQLELIVDLQDDHIKEQGFFYIHPNYISKLNCLKNNLFTSCKISNTPVEELTLNTLQNVFNTLIKGGILEININQPLAVMLDYDIRQIEANLKLVGFNIIQNKNKNTNSVLAEKPGKKEEENKKEDNKKDKEEKHEKKEGRRESKGKGGKKK